MHQTITPKSVALIGATGMVGREIVAALEDAPFPIRQLSVWASKEGSHEMVVFRDNELQVDELTNPNDIHADIAFFAAGDEVSKHFIESVSKRGILCIDMSRVFRDHKDIPLIAAGVNDYLLKNFQGSIIASACSATPLAQVLAPLHSQFGIHRVVVSTYQSVSEAGKKGNLELDEQVRDLFNMREIKTPVFGKRIAFNFLPCIPAVGTFDAELKTPEEARLIADTKKILGDALIRMDVTCVRVPVFAGNGMAVSIETTKPVPVNDAMNVLKTAPFVKLVDNHDYESYPTAIDATLTDETLVGRVRPNMSVDHGLMLFIAADNLRTSSALNAVRIARALYQR